MSLFSKKPVICPVCGDEVPATRNGSRHFYDHLDDSRGRLVLACGCTDANWALTDNFTDGVLQHLRRRHKMRS